MHPLPVKSVERSPFFHRSFDGVIAVDLIFLLSEETQEMLTSKMAAALNPGGRFLFTLPLHKVEWKDAMTEQRSISLGAEEYRALISASGLSIVNELNDEGENHYFSAFR